MGGTYHTLFSLFPHPIPLLTPLLTVERLEDKNETMKKEMKELHDRNIGVRMFGGSRKGEEYTHPAYAEETDAWSMP